MRCSKPTGERTNSWRCSPHELRNPLAPVAQRRRDPASERGPVSARARARDGRPAGRPPDPAGRRPARRRADHHAQDLAAPLGRPVVRRSSTRRWKPPVRSSTSRSEHFLCSTPETDLWLEVDAVRMAQAIGNLLHNAAKFTPPTGRSARDRA
jgi:hypothetical protein